MSGLFATARDIEPRDVLFIDEIHSLPRPVEEFLYTAMEDFRVDIPTGQRTKNVVSVDINPFTLIGATTHVPGVLRRGGVGRLREHRSR